jgi:hypothetical protein
MRIQIESTTKIVQLNNVPARIWEGHTESGIPVHCFVTRVAVAEGLPTEEFDRELQKHAPPSPAIEAIPLRLVL